MAYNNIVGPGNSDEDMALRNQENLIYEGLNSRNSNYSFNENEQLNSKGQIIIKSKGDNQQPKYDSDNSFYLDRRNNLTHTSM